MRRICDIIILFSIMLAAAGCCKHDKITVKNDVKIMLKASTTADGTRALINNKDDLVSASYTGSGFGVFGYKSLKDGSSYIPQTLVFNNAEVKPSAASGNDITWSYAPIRYWDSNINAYYQFVAYWPHLQSAQYPNNTTAPWVGNNTNDVIGQNTTAGMLLTLHNIPNWQDSASSSTNDFMVATSKGKYKGEVSGEEWAYYSNGIVPFTFSHILAKFTIKAYYIGVQENQISVYNLTLGQTGNTLLSSDGKVNYTKPFGGNPASPAFAGLQKNSGSQELFNATTELEAHTLAETAFFDEVTPANTPACKHETICSWLVVPTGGWNNLTLDISYAIGEGASPVPTQVTGISIGSPDTYSMNSGNQYILTLKFDSTSGGISVESVSVKDWTQSDINPGVYNW